MINYIGYDIKIMEAIDFALEALDYETITDKEVWEVAKLQDSIPQFENILLELSFNRLATAFEARYEELDEFNLAFISTNYEVNLRDSDFTVWIDDKYFKLDTKENTQILFDTLGEIKAMMSDEEIIG